MNIAENNKLIAEFMGLTPDKYDYYCNDPSTKEYRQRNQYINHAMKLEELEYNSSWDWIMPVVGEIQDKYNHKLGNKALSLVVGIEKTFEREIDIKETYDKVVRFIKWYNENKKN